MFSIGFFMKLKQGCYEKYKEAHDDLWPGVAQSMSENNINMVIFKFGENLILHATAPTEEDWDRSREHPALPDWQKAMTELLQDDGRCNVIFEPLEVAFEFGDFINTK